jgi:phosphoglycerate kinase
MSKRPSSAADVAGKRVLVRVDFNVPLDGVRVTDDTRIRAALPTIRDLRERGAKVVLISHLGRPKGKSDPRFSLAPVADRLSSLLEDDVCFVKFTIGPEAVAATAALAAGDVLLLENVRFHPGEERNDPSFAADLAALGDLYVNDAFGAAHRAHASVVGVAELLPAYAGQLLLAETERLGQLLHGPTRPFVAILGGAKVSDKLGVVHRLLDRVDALLIGGGMANTFLLAGGVDVGASLVENDRLDDARSTLKLAEEQGIPLLLPIDAVVAPSATAHQGRIVAVSDVPANEAMLDIGPATLARFAPEIERAGTIFWNGPMGVFEREPFASGTLGVARMVAASAGYSVVGGGDSVAALAQAGVAEQIDHVSTGGGASLEMLEGRELPGLTAIPDA